MVKGVITKGIGGFYYVDTGSRVYECRARGKFRLDNITPLIGDNVEIEVNETTSQGYVLKVHDRKNQMVRPTIANVDQAIIVIAAKKPDINMLLLQKLLVYAQHIGLDIVVCINKIDLDVNEDYKVIREMLKTIPYKVIVSSKINDIGIEELKAVLSTKISVFAGPSGAGKSSLLNLIQPGLTLKTGGLSKKIDRGTHTTRHAELIKLSCGGMVADTPGFTSLDINLMQADDLQMCFPEFFEFRNCKFNSCKHYKEPLCGIKNAVEEGSISKIRYDYYASFYEELKDNRRY